MKIKKTSSSKNDAQAQLRQKILRKDIFPRCVEAFSASERFAELVQGVGDTLDELDEAANELVTLSIELEKTFCNELTNKSRFSDEENRTTWGEVSVLSDEFRDDFCHLVRQFFSELDYVCECTHTNIFEELRTEVRSCLKADLKSALSTITKKKN